MDEDNFRRGPATSHPLEPVDDENVSKKARVARNVLHIRGDDNVKFDVREEAWPNADLVIRASYEGALIDGLPADKVKAGDEREIQQMKDLQLYSWVKETDILPDNSILVTGWARRTTVSEMRSRCERGFLKNRCNNRLNIPGMYAARKRNKQNSRDGEVSIIQHKSDSYFQQ